MTTTPPFRYWKPPTGNPVATYETTRRGSATRGKVEVYRPHGKNGHYLFDAYDLDFFDDCEEITLEEALELAPKLTDYI